MNTSNLTVTNNLFLDNSLISYWRFEAMYSFVSENSTSALNFIINQPPSNGSCSIDPLNGTTTTLFTIICSSWFDEDGIKDYSFYGIVIVCLEIFKNLNFVFFQFGRAIHRNL